MRDSLALGGGPYHFFYRSSRNAAASSICSARSFFSLAFSSSSCRSRFASETSIPPNVAVQLYSVASETPCLRAKSAVFAPAACSRSTPIICSSVNLARFICPSFRRPDSNFNWRKSAGAGQRAPLVGVAPQLRAVLAAHVSFQLMDRRVLRPANDVECDRLISVAAEAANLEPAKSAVDALRDCWRGLCRATVALRADRPRRCFGPVCLACGLICDLASVFGADLGALDPATVNDLTGFGAHHPILR